MDNEFGIALLAGVGGMLGWGLADFFAKRTIDEVGHMVSLVWAHAFGTLIFFTIWLGRAIAEGDGFALPSDLDTWSLLALFGALQAAVYFLLYKGFGKGQLALLNPLFASFSGLTALLSILLFGEAIDAQRAAALAVIFSGILLLSTDAQALRSSRVCFAHVPGLKEIALATVLAAFWTLFWGRFVAAKDWLSYALIMYGFMTAALLGVARVQRVELRVLKSTVWKFLFLIGLCETVAYLSISLGYSRTPLISIVALLSGAFSLPAILLARALLKERTTLPQALGSGAIILGIALLPLR